MVIKLIQHAIEEEIDERVKEPSFDYKDDLSNLLETHLTFRAKNPGRLVSKFLRSFLRNA